MWGIRCSSNGVISFLVLSSEVYLCMYVCMYVAREAVEKDRQNVLENGNILSLAHRFPWEISVKENMH